MDIHGKTILLTGGTAGIGAAMARQLVAKGAKVIVTGRSASGLAKARELGLEAIAADLSGPEGAEAILEALRDRPVDILINNAGQGVDHDFRESAPDVDAADDCIYANLNSPVRLVASLLPRLKQRPEAAIVNVTSGLAISPNTGSPVYCATKAALRSYTQSLRAQLAGCNVHVVEALPPVVATQMTARLGGIKMPAEDCAAQIIQAIERNDHEANIGMVRILRTVNSVSPKLAGWLMLRF